MIHCEKSNSCLLEKFKGKISIHREAQGIFQHGTWQFYLFRHNYLPTCTLNDEFLLGPGTATASEQFQNPPLVASRNCPLPFHTLQRSTPSFLSPEVLGFLQGKGPVMLAGDPSHSVCPPHLCTITQNTCCSRIDASSPTHASYTSREVCRGGAVPGFPVTQGPCGEHIKRVEMYSGCGV